MRRSEIEMGTETVPELAAETATLQRIAVLGGLMAVVAKLRNLLYETCPVRNNPPLPSLSSRGGEENVFLGSISQGGGRPKTKREADVP